MNFHILTFGCQMNAGDSDWLARTLTQRGWTRVPEDQAEVFIINTCSVREKPEQKVYSELGRMREALQERDRGFVAVGGCLAQQVGASLFGRFPHVRLVFGTDTLAMVPDALSRLMDNPRLRLSLLDFSEHYPEREQPRGSDPLPPQAFVNIMQGCDNFCAYCIVPFVRGRQKSREPEAVLAECQALVDRGVREITLVGQNVNSFGLDLQGREPRPGFAGLLKAVAAIPELHRLRFTTSHPKDLSLEVIESFGELPALCPQLHLPVQSGSDRVLGLMGRRYTRLSYLALVRRLRQVRPDIALSTDLIVGFPTETEEDFRQTLSLMEEAGFESSFSFKYCDRPGVRAASMEPKVLEEVKARRLAELQDQQTRRTDAWLESAPGARLTVLVEGPGIRGDGQWRGRDPYNRVVNFSSQDQANLTGRLVDVDILEAKKHSLKGKAVCQS